jgi:hypothetical protein
VNTHFVGVEAFDGKAEIAVRTEALSYEGTREAGTHQWIRAKSLSGWPTLMLASMTSAVSKVPVVTTNAAVMLAAAQGAKIQKQAAILFGRIPVGQTVQVSARAERATYIDKDGVRHFVFLNVEPGAHVLYVAGQGAVAAPALEGTATFLDLTAPVRRKLVGRVYDGGSRTAAAVATALVRVVGQASRVATTDTRGRFTIDEVVTYGAHPIHLEVQSKGEFTHRYRVSPLRTQAVSLFRFSSAKVESWLRQLEGGVSPESGLVVAAFPQLVAASEKASLYPTVRPVQTTGGLTSESYILGVEDRLGVAVPMDQASPRTISVQVPEGLNLVRIENRAKRAVWSELVVASPGVVNVLGPY